MNLTIGVDFMCKDMNNFDNTLHDKIVLIEPCVFNNSRVRRFCQVFFYFSKFCYLEHKTNVIVKHKINKNKKEMERCPV